jgi:hypothetical protein
LPLYVINKSKDENLQNIIITHSFVIRVRKELEEYMELSKSANTRNEDKDNKMA